MADRSLIEWCDATWNPITGCSPISDGCSHCYASRMAKRFPYHHNASIPPTMAREEDFHEVRFHPDRLDAPLRWKKPRRIFVCSMGDLFHEDVKEEWIYDVMASIVLSPRHTFMVLTKRPGRMHSFLLNEEFYEGVRGTEAFYTADIRVMNEDFPNETKTELRRTLELENAISQFEEGHPLPNLWLGVTAENQEMADQRIPILLQTPAAKRFVSVEPMLGPVDLTRWISPRLGCGSCGDTYGIAEALPDPNGHRMGADKCARCGEEGSMLTFWGNLQEEQFRTGERYEDGGPGEDKDGPQIHWIICGPENGPGARPMHPDWPRSLRDQCQAAGVPFFFKQWGEWGEAPDPKSKWFVPPGKQIHRWPDNVHSFRVGKKTAGCLLDGREWKEFPEVSR